MKFFKFKLVTSKLTLLFFNFQNWYEKITQIII